MNVEISARSSAALATASRVLVLMLGLVSAPVVSAGTVAAHQGSNNPTTEGWFQTGLSLGNISAGPGSTGGTDYWFVNDASSQGGSTLGYQTNLVNDDINDALTFGWQLRAVLENVNVPDNPLGSVFTRVNINDRSFAISYGAQGDGTQTIRLNDGPGLFTDLVLAGVGSGFFELIMDFNPLDQLVDVSVNGVTVFQDWDGGAGVGFTPAVAFGGGASLDTGHGRYAEIEFSTTDVGVPAAPGFALSLLALAALRMRAARGSTTRR